MIEYQNPQNSKHTYIKIIAWIIIFVFTWEQIALSGDFASMRLTRPPIADHVQNVEALARRFQAATPVIVRHRELGQ